MKDVKAVFKKNTFFLCFFLFVFTAAAFLLVTCTEASDNVPENNRLNDDISAEEFAGRFEPLLSNGAKLTAVDDDYISGMLGLNTDDISEYILKIQTTGTEVDQYGIFKVTAANKTEAVADSIKNYLDMLNENWQNFYYLPEEMPKINAAEVKSAGLYVVFVIAAEEEKTAVFDEFDKILKS
jgi:hypothetical protein